MKKVNKMIERLRHICLLCVIVFGLMAIIGTGGGGGDDGNTTPTANITSPSGGSSYTEGETITFSGTGSDPEDGTLTGSSLVWTSSIDGQIGTGISFTRNDLSVGIHTVTLIATDNDGETGVDSVSFTVTLIQSAPSAPTNVATTAGDGQATISWDSVSGATSYNIYWSTTTGVSKTFNEGKISGITTTSYTHAGRENDTTYYYVVTAVNNYGESADSSEVNATPYSLSIPTDGLMSWWPGNGNALDIIGPNDGTLENDATFAPGKVGQAFSFDGVDDYVIASATNISDLQQLTIDAWVKHNSLSSGSIQRYVTLGNEKAVLRYGGESRTLHFYMKIDDVLHHINVDDVLEVGVFHHVAGTYDGSFMLLYLDGVEVGSLAVIGRVATGTNVQLSGEDETLDGLLDEVKIYNRALSEAEILELYNLN